MQAGGFFCAALTTASHGRRQFTLIDRHVKVLQVSIGGPDKYRYDTSIAQPATAGNVSDTSQSLFCAADSKARCEPLREYRRRGIPRAKAYVRDLSCIESTEILLQQWSL